jgi:hypothetical protein
MKSYFHLLAAGLLCVTSISILFVSHSQDHIRALDTVRLYTLQWQKGDTAAALHEVKSDPDFLTAACMGASNRTVNPACMPSRQDKRDAILRHMQCTKYGSQACSYLRLALQPLMRTLGGGNLTGPPEEHGADLKLIRTAGGETYRQMLHRIIQEAPMLFHGAFKAVESSSTMVLRSSLYNLITVVIFANLLVHVVDEGGWKQNHVRLIVRSIAFLLVYAISFIFVIIYPGTMMSFFLILGAGTLNLVYFEMYLDPTIVRPWIHPFAFAVIYMSLVTLGLVENGVLDYNIFLVHLLVGAAASQLFMSNAWFHAGITEKMRLANNPRGRGLAYVYITKETQFGLFMGMLLQLALPLYLVMAPYAFTYKSLFLALSPAIFSVLALFSLNFVEELKLDDEYGLAMRAKEKEMGWTQDTPFATVITGGKVYASMLLLLFGAIITLAYMSEHMATARAFMDEVPEASIQLDSALNRRFLIGQGLNMLSAH